MLADERAASFVGLSQGNVDRVNGGNWGRDGGSLTEGSAFGAGSFARDVRSETTAVVEKFGTLFLGKFHPACMKINPPVSISSILFTL